MDQEEEGEVSQEEESEVSQEEEGKAGLLLVGHKSVGASRSWRRHTSNYLPMYCEDIC